MTTHKDPRPTQESPAKTLPAHYYTDPQHFCLELELIHFQMWLFAGRSEQIRRPGDYFLVGLGEESVIVLRNDEGEVRAFYNVCRHRGTRLCMDDEGKVPAALKCPYHGWTYDLNGSLKAAPHMDKTPGFTRQDYPLHPVAVDTWDGHVFINLSPQPGPLSEHLCDLPAKFRPWCMEELELAKRIVYPVKANWKLVVQNYSECLHCPLLHPQLQNLSHFLSGVNDPPRPSYLGGRMDLREGVESLTSSGKSPWPPLPGLQPEQTRHAHYYAVLPNLLLSLYPNYMMTYSLWPVAHDHTEITCDWYFHPEAMDKPGFDPHEAVELWDRTNRQDWAICQMAQRGIASQRYTPGPYSHREELLQALDRWVVERLESAHQAD